MFMQKDLEINHQFIKRQTMGINNTNKVQMSKTDTAYIPFFFIGNRTVLFKENQRKHSVCIKYEHKSEK